METLPSEPRQGPSSARKGRGCLVAVLVAGGVILLAAVAIGIAGYLWFERHGDDLLQLGKEATREGRAFGAGKTAADCIQEGLRQVRDCGGELEIRCQVRARVFGEACLGVATLPDDFCDGVPAENAILDSVTWRQDQCAARRLGGDQSCQRFFEAVQAHCHPSR